MTPLFPPIGCSYSRYMYPHKILWDAWLEAGPNLLAEKHNWLQLMLVQRPNIRPWYCAVGNCDFPTDLLCKKSTKCCPRNFLQIFPVRTLWQTQWAWRCTTGRWSLGRLPGAQVDPSWSTAQIVHGFPAGSLWITEAAAVSTTTKLQSARSHSCHALVPCRSMQCQKHPEAPFFIHCNKLIFQHLSNQLAKCYENLFLPVDDSEHTLCYRVILIPNVCCCLSLTD